MSYTDQTTVSFPGSANGSSQVENQVDEYPVDRLLRVLYHHRLGSKDGQFVHVEVIVAALREQGHDVRVIGPASVQRASFGGEAGHVARLKGALPRAAYEALELGYGVAACRRLLRAAARHRPDVIYERYNLHLPAGAMAARRLGIPLLLEVNAPLAFERGTHNGLGLPGLARRTEARIWRAAAAVLTVSEPLAAMIEAAGVSNARIHVLPNAVDASRFAGLPSRAEAKRRLGLAGRTVVGFVGFIRAWHGLAPLVDWLAERATPDTVLYLIGDGPARPLLEEQARARGVAERLLITGTVPHAAVASHLAAVDIAVQPDVVPYAAPLKLPEYMAAGCAIVAVDRPNIRALLVDGRHALLRPPERVADAVDQLLADPGLAARRASAASAEIGRRDLTWSGNARRIAAIARIALAARGLA